MIRCGHAPDEPHANCPALVQVIAEEDADTIIESPREWRVETSGARVDPVNRPYLRVVVVQTQGQPLVFQAVEREAIDISARGAPASRRRFRSGSPTPRIRRASRAAVGGRLATGREGNRSDGCSPAYLFFFFAATLFVFSFTRNVTMSRISPYGIGWFSGKRTEPFAPSYADSSLLNFSIPDGPG